MKILLLFSLLVFNFAAYAQTATVLDILETVAVAPPKFENYLAKKGFVFIGSTNLNDTVAKEYIYKGTAKEKPVDSIKRGTTFFSSKEDFCFTYHTYSAAEYKKIINQLTGQGFFCNRQKDSLTAASLLFQHADVTVNVSSEAVDSLTEYNFLVRKQPLPKPKEILFAEDLAIFNSHEYLRYYFGDKNVKKDIYYLSENQVAKCSVLFANSNRQVVFLWSDEADNCGLEKMYFGGQLQSASSMQYDKIVEENLWQLKSGIHAGMSLYALRILNDAAFNFYGGNSPSTGTVLAENTGKIDFKKTGIILGCMNCTDADFFKKAVINSDDAMAEQRILFVQTIILNPAK
ncbi:MAG: hypothetical protein ABJA37_03860 [Ferruginibacter sp.]